MKARLDLVIRNATIVNGLGEPEFIADIGIHRQRLARIGTIDEAVEAEQVIDGSGLIACPGYIDTHTHADLSIQDDPGADNFVAQGVTTVVGGHCGISLAPVGDPRFQDLYMSRIGVKRDRDWSSFDEWLRFIEEKEIGVNYIPLVGHNVLRGGVLGTRFQRASRKKEVELMKERLLEALRAGAFGLSAGLDGGTSGHYADQDEIVELLKVVKAEDGLFAPHTRHHQNQWPTDGKKTSAYGLYSGPKAEVLTGRYHGLVEVVEYVRQVPGCRMLISHLTPVYLVPQPHPAYLDEAIARASVEEIIDKPRREGLDVYFSMLACDDSVSSELPIARSFFNPMSALPEWLRSMELDQFASSLPSAAFRRKLKAFVESGKFKFGMLSPATDPYWSECYRIVACDDSHLVGRTVFDLARERSPRSVVKAIYDEAFEVVCDIIARSPRATWALIKDKREAGTHAAFLSHSCGMPCTDAVSFPEEPVGRGAVFGFGVPPSAYNMMPSYLLTMVKEKALLSRVEAIRRLTSLPAQIFGIEDRGSLKEGNWADIVLLDWDQLRVWNDYTRPNRKPEGIRCVIVNGTIAYRDGALSHAHTGRVVRKGRTASTGTASDVR